jgi:hypothetical protein
MNLRFKIVSIFVLSIFLIAACGKKDEETQPASASGTTNTAGQATLNIGSSTLNVTVQDSASNALSNIGLNAYLLHENIVVIANDTSDSYYPSIVVTGQGTLARPGLPSRVQSPEGPADVAVDATITLYPVQIEYYEFHPDPSNFDRIITDEWTVEQNFSGSLSDVYNRTDSMTVFNQGLIVHLDQSVANAIEAPARTAAFVTSQISDYATFASLVGLAFHIFEGDTLTYSLMTYSGATVPLINVSNLVANRNFWAQFTLVWGEEPRDIDSHLWTPMIEGYTYEVYYGYPGAVDTPPFANLDVDDVTSYGPEHVTIHDNFTGTYTYAVYHFSGEGTIATSGASVSLLRPDGTVQAFSVPTDTTGVQPYWWWHVCEVDGQTGVVTPINILSPNEPQHGYVPSRGTKPVHSKTR